MCAFHHSLQTGSLFEREGRWDRGYAFHGWQFHLCRGRKIQKFRSFSIEELGEVGKVVLTRLVTRKAIGMRFEEGWSWFLVWKRLGKRKISCFWGGHRLRCTCFWKFMKALKGSNKDSARPAWCRWRGMSLSKYSADDSRQCSLQFHTNHFCKEMTKLKQHQKHNQKLQ